MQQEASIADAREFPTSQLKRSVILSKGFERLRVEPDQSISYLYSARMGRLVFGRESVELFKVQAGIVIPQRQKDTRVRVSPEAVELWSPDPAQMTHTIRLQRAGSVGYSRSIRLTNRSETPLRLRVVALHDPTTMNFRREKDPPGEIGVNAFNRGDHVVMDDVGDTTGVRVIGFSPRPSTIYMTKDRQRALDLLSSGELPGGVAGISGSILMLTQWDFDIQTGGRADLRVAAFYHPSSLEVALSDNSASAEAVGRDRTLPAVGSVFRCSMPSMNFGFSWARAALDSIEGEEDRLDRLSSGFGLQVFRPDYFTEQFDVLRRSQDKDGLIPRADTGRGGPVETAMFLVHSSGYLRLKGDKKLAKKWYTAMRKAGVGLQKLAKSGLISSGPAADGWRRRLGSGYPTGVLSEVNLLVARALADLAEIAYMVGKGSDSAGFRETNVKMVGALNGSLKDTESGTFALNLDPQGRLHKELTADQAIALYCYPLDHNVASSMVHRLLEKDFETGYGPRTIPTSNALYYSSNYGDGQLGGYWTRAALVHALLAYATGYPSIACLQLEKVARLVYSECEKMGGVPGEFPYWLDPERKTIAATGSDPVSASRFLEALLVGELGLDRSPRGVRFNPPAGSKLRWLMLHDVDLGGRGSFFLGRSATGVYSASSYPAETEGGGKFHKCERLELPSPLEGLFFWDEPSSSSSSRSSSSSASSSSSTLVCLGNTGTADCTTVVSIPVKGKPISRSLYLAVEEMNQETKAWQKVERKKSLERIEIRAEIKSGAWKWFRLSQIVS